MFGTEWFACGGAAAAAQREGFVICFACSCFFQLCRCKIFSQLKSKRNLTVILSICLFHFCCWEGLFCHFFHMLLVGAGLSHWELLTDVIHDDCISRSCLRALLAGERAILIASDQEWCLRIIFDKRMMRGSSWSLAHRCVSTHQRCWEEGHGHLLQWIYQPESLAHCCACCCN